MTTSPQERSASLSEPVAALGGISASILHSFQTTLDSLPSPVFIKDRLGRYVACNKAFEGFIGLPRDRIIGATVYDVAPEALAAVYARADNELLAQGGTQIYEARVRYADGSEHDIMFHKSVFYDPAGQAEGISGLMLDITERKFLESQLAQAAATDFLTGVNNLRTFHTVGGQEFRHFVRDDRQLSLMAIDVDRFKQVNDQLGHLAGDEALKQIVGVMSHNLRDTDILARSGGDEFLVLLPDTLPAGAASLAERIRQEISQITVTSERGAAMLSISIGIAACKAGDQDLDDIIRRADAALYSAKNAGRNCVHLAQDTE